MGRGRGTNTTHADGNIDRHARLVGPTVVQNKAKTTSFCNLKTQGNLL